MTKLALCVIFAGAGLLKAQAVDGRSPAQTIAEQFRRMDLQQRILMSPNHGEEAAATQRREMEKRHLRLGSANSSTR